MQNCPGNFARFLGRPPKTLDWALLVSLLSILLGPGSATTINQVSNSPIATATAAPTHTASPPEKPTIGAPDSAFAAAFSSRLDDQDWQLQVADQTLVLHVIEHAGTDSQQRIIFAALDPYPADLGKVTFPQATVVAYIKQFLPADAHETGTETGKDGIVTHLPHSASLVPLLPASAYSFGQPGDLYWVCNRIDNPTGLDNCEVGLA
jgi:hypothetical protein